MPLFNGEEKNFWVFFLGTLMSLIWAFLIFVQRMLDQEAKKLQMLNSNVAPTHMGAGLTFSRI